MDPFCGRPKGLPHIGLIRLTDCSGQDHQTGRDASERNGTSMGHMGRAPVEEAADEAVYSSECGG